MRVFCESEISLVSEVRKWPNQKGDCPRGQNAEVFHMKENVQEDDKSKEEYQFFQRLLSVENKDFDKYKEKYPAYQIHIFASKDLTLMASDRLLFMQRNSKLIIFQKSVLVHI